MKITITNDAIAAFNAELIKRGAEAWEAAKREAELAAQDDDAPEVILDDIEKGGNLYFSAAFTTAGEVRLIDLWVGRELPEYSYPKEKFDAHRFDEDYLQALARSGTVEFASDYSQTIPGEGTNARHLGELLEYAFDDRTPHHSENIELIGWEVTEAGLEIEIDGTFYLENHETRGAGEDFASRAAMHAYDQAFHEFCGVIGLNDIDERNEIIKESHLVYEKGDCALGDQHASALWDEACKAGAITLDQWQEILENCASWGRLTFDEDAYDTAKVSAVRSVLDRDHEEYDEEWIQEARDTHEARQATSKTIETLRAEAPQTMFRLTHRGSEIFGDPGEPVSGEDLAGAIEFTRSNPDGDPNLRVLYGARGLVLNDERQGYPVLAEEIEDEEQE